MSGCATCGKTASLKKCSRCQSVAYCSPECQKANWKQHKPTCTPVNAQPTTLTSAQAKLEAERMRRELIEKLHLADESHSHQHGGGHGHSHGGKPCGGHGPPQAARVVEPPVSQPEAHGHSHGGKPCGGHGGPNPDQLVKMQEMQAKLKAKQQQQQHSHAHGASADHGHSHGAASDHGHSHNGQPCHGHGNTAASPPPAEHGHSHNGQPCHGHGNSASGHQGHQLKIYVNPSLTAVDSEQANANISVNGAKSVSDKPIHQIQYSSQETDRPVINGQFVPESVQFIPLSSDQTIDPEDKDTDLRSSFCPTCAMANTGFITAASDSEKAFMQELQDNHVEIAKGVEADYKENCLVSFVEGSETNDISEYPDCIAELHIASASLPIELNGQSAVQPMTIVQLMMHASQPPPTDAEASKAFFNSTSGEGRTLTRRFEFIAETTKLDTPVKLPHLALDYGLAALRREIESANPNPLFTYPAHMSVWTDRCEWMGQASPVDPYAKDGSKEPVSERLLYAERMQINMALQSMWKAWNIKEMEVAVFPPGHARSMLLKWQEQTEPVQRFFVQL